MCACREGSEEISVVMLVGADVVCIDDDVSIAEVKLHDAENKGEPELGHVACNFWELWAKLRVSGFIWVKLLVLLILPVERLLQLLWEVEAIPMVVLLLWLWRILWLEFS